MRLAAIVLSATLLSAQPLLADAGTACLFGDHMVLQRTAHVPVWGTATAGEHITVDLGTAHAETTAGPDGKWHVDLNLQQVPPDPMQMVIQARNRIVFTDVLVGEVWLAGGQSNMEFALAQSDRAKEDIPAANNNLLRQFKVLKAGNTAPQEACTGHWEAASPATAGQFSAVAYYFGLTLQRELHVPVGLINSNYGGSHVEAWLSPTALAALPRDRPIRRRDDKREEHLPRAAQAVPNRLRILAGTLPPRRSRAARKPTRRTEADQNRKPPRRHHSSQPSPRQRRRHLAQPHRHSARNRRRRLPLHHLWPHRRVRPGLLERQANRATTAAHSDSVAASDHSDYGRRYDVPGDRVQAGPATLTIRIFNPAGAPTLEGAPRAEGLKLDGPWRARVDFAQSRSQPKPAPASPASPPYPHPSAPSPPSSSTP